MGAHIYNLNATKIGAAPFHKALSDTTDEILSLLYKGPSSIYVKEFQDFITENNVEARRSKDEYFIEFIMIGVLWKTYAPYASGLKGSIKNISNLLYSCRQHSDKFREPIDKIRGRIASKFLFKKDKSYELLAIVENLELLIDWLDASKEFIEEVKRLKNWFIFLKKKSPIYITKFLSANKEATQMFIAISRSNLNSYTNGVNPFISKTKKDYKNRTDLIFCSRNEDEYFFNMVAVEILNRAHKLRFNLSTRKVLLLPVCMQIHGTNHCKAKTLDGTNYDCTGCTSICRVNQIRKQAEPHHIEVKIVPHSTQYSKSLKQWHKHPNVGLVKVGCVLKLLSEALEMISHNIPSQVVFLDYCGCKKHWPSIDQPTDLNNEALMSKFDIAPESEQITNLEMVFN